MGYKKKMKYFLIIIISLLCLVMTQKKITEQSLQHGNISASINISASKITMKTGEFKLFEISLSTLDSNKDEKNKTVNSKNLRLTVELFYNTKKFENVFLT